MANKSLFSSIKSRLPRAAARNEAGRLAYGCPLSTPWPKWPRRVASAAPTTPAPRASLRCALVDHNVFLAKLALPAASNGSAASP